MASTGVEPSLCVYRPASAHREVLQARLASDGTVFAPPGGDAAWWLQIGDRASLGFDPSTTEPCDLDTWATLSSARPARWVQAAPVRAGTIASLFTGQRGAIYDTYDGDDFYDPAVGAWWVGDTSKVDDWIAISPTMWVGCHNRQDATDLTLVAMALFLPPQSDGS